ncbi:hypothetical protein ACC839_03550 [Rhizobium ruizarguesonis]|jgi:hypothetical protein|nr:hypothetical protein [Rhizobium ruizarguesonis]
MARAACGGLMRAAEDVQKFGTFTYAADAVISKFLADHATTDRQ